MSAPTPDAGVRRARPDDAAAVGAVQAEAWASAYDALLPTALVPPAADLAQAWSAAITAPPTPRHRVLVATAGPTVVGFAALAPAPDPADGTELVALLVAPAAARAGHGSRLLNAAADTAREDGATGLHAWVPEPDAVRLAFLRAAGFANDGGVRVLQADDDVATTVREIRLSVRLDDVPA